jgi:uncharacterized protein (TIGR03435 family)
MQGVTGADLLRRIEQIMTPHLARKLTIGKKLLLASAGLFSILGPIALGFIDAPPVRAQDQQRLSFEVASVKLNNAIDRQHTKLQMETLPGGRLVASMPLQMIVALAYDIPFQSPRLTGGPEWQKATSGWYDIEATAPRDAFPPGMSVKARDEKAMLMLRSLLEDRFKMKMRISATEQPVYALVVDKGGPKLQLSKTQEKDCDDIPTGSRPCHSPGGGQGRGIHGDAVTIADVALFVQNWSDKPVIDKTGLTSLYNIQTEGWIPMRPRPFGPDGKATTGGDAGIYDPDRQTLFDVFRQLGLKMESQRAVLDMYFVEHIEQPTAN